MGKVKQPPTKRYPLGIMKALKLYKDDERYDVTSSKGRVWPDDPEDMRWCCVSAPGFLSGHSTKSQNGLVVTWRRTGSCWTN